MSTDDRPKPLHSPAMQAMLDALVPDFNDPVAIHARLLAQYDYDCRFPGQRSPDIPYVDGKTEWERMRDGDWFTPRPDTPPLLHSAAHEKLVQDALARPPEAPTQLVSPAMQAMIAAYDPNQPADATGQLHSDAHQQRMEAFSSAQPTRPGANSRNAPPAPARKTRDPG